MCDSSLTRSVTPARKPRVTTVSYQVVLIAPARRSGMAMWSHTRDVEEARLVGRPGHGSQLVGAGRGLPVPPRRWCSGPAPEAGCRRRSHRRRDLHCRSPGSSCLTAGRLVAACLRGSDTPSDPVSRGGQEPCPAPAVLDDGHGAGVSGPAGSVPSYQIRDAQPGDAAAVSDVYRRSSLSNHGDRDQLLAHPDSLVFDAASVRRRTHPGRPGGGADRGLRHHEHGDRRGRRRPVRRSGLDAARCRHPARARRRGGRTISRCRRGSRSRPTTTPSPSTSRSASWPAHGSSTQFGAGTTDAPRSRDVTAGPGCG